MVKGIFRRVLKKSGFFVFSLKNINFLRMLRWTQWIAFLKPCRYHGPEIQESFAPKVKKTQKCHWSKMNFFPKFGQIACCFWQDCRNNKFLLMFEKVFRRVCKKSGFYVFFHKTTFLRTFPWPHLITFLKPCPYHGAEIQEFVAPKAKKVQK